MALSNQRPPPEESRKKPLERSMAIGVSDEEWTQMTEAQRWEAIGEQPYEPDAYEPGGPGWVHD